MRVNDRLRRPTLALIALLASMAACDGDHETGDTDDTDETRGSVATAATIAMTTTTVATVPGASIAPPATAPAGSSPPISTTAPPSVGDPIVSSELVTTVESPVGLGVRPGDSSLYVLEQAGHVIKVVPVEGGDAERSVVADLDDRIDSGGERGLLGIAFSADGARAWLDYTDNDGNTVVAEYPVAADGTFDVAAERVLLTIDQPYPNHNGGDLVIGPDGMLYVAMGDGGSGGDPQRRASDTQQLLGKLLRIDPNPNGDAQYTVPADNPFGNEVWSYGLRNPWKIAFDPVTGELWVADVGQNAVEEINVVAPTDHPAGWGVNFGWSAYEGNERYNDDVEDPGDLVFPVVTYGHEDGCSVSGGAVYRGTAIPELAPAYVYSDYCSGVLWAYDQVGQRTLTLGELDSVTAIRTGPDAELYVLQAGGDVLRLIAG
jgi:glucose/arabinose dehydrogenase